MGPTSQTSGLPYLKKIIFHEKTGHFTLNATILDKKHIQYIMTTTLTIKDEGDQTQLTNFLKDLRSFIKDTRPKGRGIQLYQL